MKNCSLFPLLLLLLLLVLIQSIQIVDSESNAGKNSQPVQWQILTKINYSSEIRRHPHLLLMITVPWCGESRSLRKELVDVVTSEQERFGTLKLMLLYRNNERMLANALGASEGITILYFHHSLAYKYGGRLRVQNLLSSIHSVMSLLPGELHLKFLITPDELRNFLDSTDKALLLLEFCGWTPRLLAKGLSEETNGTLVWEEEKKQKAVEDNKMSCSIDDGFSAFPSFEEFISGNDDNLPEAENMTLRDSFSCTLDELQRLESFFPKFIKLSRDFFLPPERLRFGLVSDRSLLSELDIDATAPWFMKLYSAGCPSCSKVLREGDDLKIVLETQDSVVKELRDDVHDVPTLPANGPSVLLFIDRSAESLSIREKSKEALKVFRELALHHQNSNQKCGQSTLKLEKSSHETFQALSTSKTPKSELFPALQKLNLKDKMSIMIMNDGRQISLENFISDFQGGSVHEVLANLLQQKKKSKLSALAKDAGFQLLSDDFDIKDTDDVSAQPERQSDQVLALSTKGDLKVIDNLDEDSELQLPGTFKPMTDDESKPTGAGFQLVHEKDPIGKSEKSSEKFTYVHSNEVVGYAQDRKFEEERLAEVHEQIQQKNFSGSFFFCDGHFRLLKALTAASSKIPALVIVDPSMQKHFILPETDVFNFSLISDFLNGFLNGSLIPYQQSQPILQSPREAPIPPFVNLDFHEAESIPQVTAHTFAELVIGNESDYEKCGNPWDTDVLVLFTSGWCGFCQRMEMVVREVYRAIKGYADILKVGSRSKNFLLCKDNTEIQMKVPRIYLMDCSLNDCSLMLKTIVQRELYPSLLLFPAGQKNAIIYKGDVAVYDVITFLSEHGTLVNEKGISWAGVEQGGSFSGNVPLYQTIYHEVLLKDQIREMVAAKNKGHSSSGSHESTSQVVAGSILTATDKLTNTHPFDESKILIFKVDQASGYEGLIVNKHIHWESLEELDGNIQMLKQAPLSYGGPVMMRGMPLVALAHKSENHQHLEVLPDVHFLDQWATLQLMEELKLGNKSIHGYWFFLGFSSWGWEQLFHEIAEGAWDVSKGTIEQLDWPEVS